MAALAVVAAVATSFTPSAEAKFKISLAVEPARPIARHHAGVTMRTGIVLPRRESMRLIAVGPWRDDSGQTVLDVRLMRTGPRAFTANIRFPYAGRWRLTVLGSAPLPPVGATVTVRPRC